MEMAVFALFALLALGSSLMVVAHRNPIYSTLSLVLTLFAVAVLFVLLGAPFIATLQLLIYAGAILVLFLFVIMLLNIGRDEGVPGGHRAQLATAIIGGAVFAGMLALVLRQGFTGAANPPLTAELVSLGGLARELFTEYLLPFEIVGLLLLVAVIGATVVARRPTAEEIATGLDVLAAADTGTGMAAHSPQLAHAPFAAWAEEEDRAGGGARPETVPGGRAAAGAPGASGASGAPGAGTAGSKR
jgi:NADH-quinone oxidoreductase subunit J